MKKNATIAIVLVVVGVPVLVGASLQALQLSALLDRTGAGGESATFTVVLVFASLIAIGVGICFGLTAVVQRVDQHRSAP